MKWVVIAAALIVLLASGVGAVEETVQGRIKITRTWAHETRGARAVVHLTIANMGARADRLLRASTPIASRVLILDQLSNEGSGLVLPGRSEFVLGVDTPRVELIGLTKSLKASETFDLQLVFKQAGKIIVRVEVE